MTTWRLALAYARRRPLATLLNVLLLAVGVATITLVILLTRALETRMQREAAGIDLVVGAKGSPLQLSSPGSTTPTCRRATCRCAGCSSCARIRWCAK